MNQALLDPATHRVDVDLDRSGSHVVATVSGRLDQHTAGTVVRRVRSWADDGVRAVVLDLAGLDVLDGYGLAALLRCRRVLRARAGALVVQHAPAPAEATLRRSGLLLPDQRRR